MKNFKYYFYLLQFSKYAVVTACKAMRNFSLLKLYS